MRLTAEVLGPVRLAADGTPVDLGGPRQRRLLGALVVNRGSVVSTDRLIDAVFDGEPPDAARRTFRTYVARLRRALDVAGVDASRVLVTEAKGYLLPESAIDVDSAEFEGALADAQDRLTSGDADGAVLGLDEALALWSGPAYGEFADEEWASVEAIRLTALKTVARELRAEAVLESGRHAAIIPDIEALMEEEPFREEPRRLLMLALYRSGRQADALRAGRGYRRFLADETGLEPSRQFSELEQLIIDQDPRLEARPQGRKLRGYVLGPPIAESDLGITYRATQPSVGREVAITAIPAEQADDPAFVRRFEVHAQRIASIEHPNVVPLYDYWREPGAAYLVTRFLPGGTLGQRLSERSLTDDERMTVVRQVGAALAAAHERGIVHGQLDPSRVLFDDGGTAYITGFALDADPRSTPTDIAGLGQLAGQLWAQVSDQSGETQAGVAVASRVRTIADRSRTRDDEVPFGSVAELVASIEAAAAGRSGAATPALPTIEGPNPFRGLYAFAESDAEVFFGREHLVEDLVSDLAAHPFLAVVGPSGSGKSSVVRAGLLPRLRASGALVATMVPGEHPIAELEIALSRVASAPVPDLEGALAGDPAGLADVLASILPDADRQLVLLIDQFEEVFTLSDGDERDVLMTAITETLDDPSGRLRVVVTARADFLGPILDHPTVGAAVRDHSRLVTPLEPEELHVAIVGPAETAGVAVESALATTLVSDAAASPGSLPLLQYSLTELYEHRVDGTMTIDSYHRLGGMGAVLSQRAEEIYSGLDPEVQAASRRLFSRLITPGEGVEDTRRRARQSELVGVSTELLDTYGAARLIAFDRDPVTREPTVEVAHETIIRQWPRLRGWIDEDRDGLRILHHLTMAAAAWEKADRDDGELYRGARLETADEWAAEHPNEMSDGERAFLDTGTARRDADIDLERRRIRRLRSLLAAVGVVAVLALVAGLIALAQRREADENAAEAEVRRVTAESERAAAGEDPSLGLLLALEALRMEPSNEGLGALQRAGVSVPTNWLGDIENGASYRRVAYLPDGTLLAVHEEALEVWDVDERVLLRDVALDAAPTDIDVSTDGSVVVVGAVDGSWRAFDIADFALTASGTAELPDDGETGSITVIRLGPAGEILALGLDDGRVEIHGLIDPDLDRVIAPVDTAGNPITASVKDIALRADGKVFAAAWGLSADVQQFETTTESEPLRFEESPESFVLLYDDDVLHTAFQEVWSFDSETGEPVSAPISGTRGLNSGAFLVALDTSHLMLVDGAFLTTVDLADGSVSADSVPIAIGRHSAIAPDGRTLAVATATGLSFWAMDGAGMFVDTVVPEAEANAQFHAISSDGSIIVQGGNVGDQVPTRIWRVDGPAPVLVLELPPGYGVRQSGTDVIRFHAEGDPRDRIELDRWNPATNDFEAVAVSDTASFGTQIPVLTPDGNQFLHPWGTPDGIVEVYDVASQQLVVRLDHVMEAAPAADSFPGVPTFSTDGRVLVVPTFEDWVGVYEVGTWELIDLLEPDDGFQEIVFTPDGQRAITLSTRGLEIRDAADLRTVIEGPVISKGEAKLGRVLEITTDGRYLKVARLSGAQLWDAERLEPIGAPFPDGPDQWAATLAADTNQLTTVADRATLVWNIDLGTWPELACFAAGRNLTREEWEEFGPGGDYHATCDRWPAG